MPSVAVLSIPGVIMFSDVRLSVVAPTKRQWFPVGYLIVLPTRLIFTLTVQTILNGQLSKAI